MNSCHLLLTLNAAFMFGEPGSDAVPPAETVSRPVVPAPQKPAAPIVPNYPAIDRHALRAPAEAEESIPKLARYLSKPCRNDFEKARAVYRWITDRVAYDVDGLLSGKPLDVRPEAALWHRKSICDGYATLFLELCQQMELPAVKVTGYAKGMDFVPRNGQANGTHAWNAVKLDGCWYLIDPTWGAGNVNGKVYVKRNSDLYFLISPEKLSFTHFPSDPTWQLRERPLSFPEFQQQPRVEASLLKLGVSAEAIRGTIAERGFRELVHVYGYEGSATALVAGPLAKHLLLGEDYTWHVRSDDFIKMAVFQNGWSAPLEKVGNAYRVRVKVQKGKLTIGGAPRDSDMMYSLILEYAVE